MYGKNTVLHQNHKIKYINSFMIAILLTSNFISMLLASLGIIEEGLLPVLFIFSLVISYFTAFCLNVNFFINKYNLFFIFIIFLSFIITFFFRGTNSFASEYFIEFLFFGVIVFLIVIIPFSPKQIIIFTMQLGNFILINPFGFRDFISLTTSYDRVGMGPSYAILPCVIATLIYFFFLRNVEQRRLNIISYISNAYLLYLLIIEGTRGAVLAIFMLFCFIVYIKLSISIKGKIHYLYPIIFSFISISVCIILLNLEKFFLWIYENLSVIGFHSATLIKTASLVEEKGLVGALNNRDLLYENAFILFKQSPIWGHGIGSFADHFNGAYPHNLILHLLVEGGILLILPFITILILCFWFLVKPWSNSSFNEFKYLVLFLFIISIPRLMFSSYLWQNQAFWLLIFVFIFTYVKRINVNSSNFQ